jgi:DNA repair exonuclease SbcCD nuclease subunit
MVEHEPAYKPLRHAPDRHGDTWNIGMAHGFYVDYPETMRSSLITPDEIAASGFDYLALGHVHAHRQMRHGKTLACYPGVCAAHMGTIETGCVAVVTLTPGKGAKAVAHTLGGEGERRRA